MKETYEFTFTFEFYDDIIIYKTKRECLSKKGYAANYAKAWVKKYGFKYGKCISVKIQKCVDNE